MCFTLRSKWGYGATIRDRTLSHSQHVERKQAGISSSLQRHSEPRNVLERSIPQSLCLGLSRDPDTFQHIITLWKQKSKVWPPKCLETCLLAGVWWAGLLTSCLGLFSPTRIFSTVQPDPGIEGGGAGAQESVWHNRNNWGSVCKASRREWERNRKQECCYGVHYWKRRRLHACDLHSLLSVGYITEQDWVWACICIRLSWSGTEEEEFDLTSL